MNAQLKPAETGIFYDLPAAEYHTKVLGEISNSGIKRLLRSPAHYRAWIEDADESADSPTLAFGRAFHCALLEPDVFARTYSTDSPPDSAPRRPSSTQRNAAKPSQATLDAIAFWDQWDRDHAGQVQISREDYERIRAMIASVQAHPLAGRAIRDGASEVTVRCTDEATGLPCKARADYFVDGKVRYVLDVKTCEDASPEEFAKAVSKYGYHIQHAHYAEAFRAAGKPLQNYLFLAVEHKPPYAVAVYHIDAAAEARGFELRQRAIDAAARCTESGIWPAYPTGITQLTLPSWALKD